MSALGGSLTTILPEADLVRFNQWLWITRLRSISAALVLVLLLKAIDPTSVGLESIMLVCTADIVVSLGYHRWLRLRRQLRALAYVQLGVDTLAITAGLFFIHDSPVLFHFVLLLAVVPASMVEWQCGLVIAVLASAGHFALLWLHGGPEVLSVGGLMPPASFFLILNQSLFYVRHLAQKNVDLAAAAESLNDSNCRLEEEAAIASALLRAAQALITSLHPPELLERLNGIVREALDCDWSVTLLHDSQRDVYRVAAVAGIEAAIVEDLRAVEFPADSAPLFSAVTQQGLVAVEDQTSPLFSPDLMAQWRFTSFLCASLERAGVSVGLLAAGFNQREGPFSPREVRLFRSIAQQAAIALENARLVEGLRAASRLKSEFIGTMSHELRSPLNVVIGYVDLLLEGDMGELNEEVQQTLERVRQHALQLLDLIQETLDVNRLEAGMLPLDLETFTLHEFVQELRSSIPSDWQKPQVALQWEMEPVPILIRSDRAKLKKVLRNLVHNALKFTDCGAVIVKVSRHDGWVDFAVQDTGMGISPEALPIIFEMFRQIDGSTTRRHGGVGLGLYIVKQLVRGLGGEIDVTSSVGAGSVFHVRLRGE
jgi:signal transduction histidine kinase